MTFSTPETRQFMAIVALVAGGFAGVGAFLEGHLNPARPDPHTGAADKAAMEEFKEYFSGEMDIVKREFTIQIQEIQLPPTATRIRVKAIERYLEKNGEYEPPTQDWQ